MGWRRLPLFRRQDSNLRPPPYESGELTELLYSGLMPSVSAWGLGAPVHVYRRTP